MVGAQVKNLRRDEMSNQGEVLDQLSKGQKPFESTFFHPVTLLKAQITDYIDILSDLAKKYFS